MSSLPLVDDIATDRSISAEEALRALHDLLPNGVASREHAEALIALEARVAESDEAWTLAFVEALTTHVLQAGVYPGHVDEPTTAWLMATLGERPRVNGLEALVKILERAQSAPESLREFVRARIALHIAGRAVSAADAALVRRVVFARPLVSEVEVRWLFALDAESDGRDNDPAWGDLFVKAALRHVAGKSSPAAIEEAALQALEARIAPRPAVSPLEALKSFLKGGFAGYRAQVSARGPIEALEQRYQAANDAGEERAIITADEIASLRSLSQPAARLTANEQALIAELHKLETEQA